MSKTNCCTINQVKQVVGHAQIQSKEKLKVQIITEVASLSSSRETVIVIVKRFFHQIFIRCCHTLQFAN